MLLAMIPLESFSSPWMPRAQTRYSPVMSAGQSNPLDGLRNATIMGVEGAVKAVTGDDAYKFGDLYKKVVKDLSGKDVDDCKCMRIKPNVNVVHP